MVMGMVHLERDNVNQAMKAETRRLMRWLDGIMESGNCPA